MQAYILRRILALIPTLIFASIIVFTSVRLIPGDIIDMMLSQNDVSANAMDREALIKALADNTPGLDGIAKADLLLLSDEASDWLALFFQKLERGVPWPTCSNIARTAFLSKWEDDLDPKGYRGLAILSVC